MKKQKRDTHEKRSRQRYRKYRARLLAGIIAALALFAILAVAGWMRASDDLLLPGRHQDVFVANNAVEAVIVDTSESRKRGLSGSEGLGPDEGMLFVFQEEGRYPFWMKDMNYPIDIIWIASGGRIVGFWEHAEPESYPRSFAPDEDALYVLEVVAGYVEAHGLKIGDTVRI